MEYHGNIISARVEMSYNPNWLGSGNTSANINSGFVGYAALGGSNTTISNANITANSIILITPVSTTAGQNMPVINAVRAGSFDVLVSLAGAGRPTGVNYLIGS